MKIIVFGAGAWGTALALSACREASAGHSVTLCARDPAQAAAMQTERENRRYLPGIRLPPDLNVITAGSVAAGATPARLATDADLVLVATPMAGLRATLSGLRH